LENSIQELRQAFGRDDPEACQAVAVQATELSKRAQAALERGATRLAIAIAEVAKDLVEQCEKGR
jgi:phage shock protein A